MDNMTLLKHFTWIISMTVISCNPDAKRLYDDLIMKGYNRNVRPSTNHNASTIIHFGMRLAQIVRVDEVNQIMTVNMWIAQEWIDPRFIWNPLEYNNISMLFVPANKLWLPDIVLYNNADGDYTITSGGKATIYTDGRVVYNPPMQFKSSCEIDVQYFPFDEQLCNLKFGPWTHDASKVDILHLARQQEMQGTVTNRFFISKAAMLDDYQRSAVWDLMSVTAQENIITYPCCPSGFPDVTFYIKVRRKHLYYVYNLIIPCMSMNILTVLSFYLPSFSGEKIGITMSVFVSMSIFNLVLFDLTPTTSLNLPLIAKYILVTSLLVTISVVANTVILNMNHRMSSTHKMSRFVRWLFLRILSRLLYVRLPTSDKETSPLDENMFSYSAYFNDISNNRNSHRDNRNMLQSQSLNTLNFEEICKACQDNRLSKYPPTIKKGFDGTCFLAKHYQDEDEAKRLVDEWCYVALIADRVLLWIYIIISLVITMEIFMNAPALYSDEQPLELP